MKKILFALALVSICAGPAFGHAINIYAWLENDQILVQCDFGRDRPAINAAITVFDSTDRQKLLTGATNAEGRFTFTVPPTVRQGRGLLIEVNAGQGHRGEWSMDASELYAAASLTAGFDEAAINSGQPGHAHVELRPTAPLPAGAVTPEQVRSIVQEAMELKLAPVRQELARQASSAPSLAEIIGGIGWIIGLVGIALYFKSRRA